MEAANLNEHIALVHAIKLLLLNAGRNSKDASLGSEGVESAQNIILQSNQSNNEAILNVEELNLDQNIMRQSSDQSKNDGAGNTNDAYDGAGNTNDAESSENIVGQSSHPKNKKISKGYTYMLEIWGRDKNLPPIPMMYDESGKPVGPQASKYSEFLCSIARNGAYWPIDVEAWHKMPKEKKMDMLNLVKTRYDTTLIDDSSIMSSISCKWRNYKKSLKKYWVPDTLEYKVEDSRVSKVQFLNLVRYWNKEETRKRCLENKDARSKKKMNHHTGKKSFAEIDYDLVNKLDRKPSRPELFESIWLEKENIPYHIKKILAKMEEKRKALPEGVEDTIGPNDIFAQVLGPDPPGYVRMVGTGTTPSAAWGNSATKYSSSV